MVASITLIWNSRPDLANIRGPRNPKFVNALYLTRNTSSLLAFFQQSSSDFAAKRHMIMFLYILRTITNSEKKVNVFSTRQCCYLYFLRFYYLVYIVKVRLFLLYVSITRCIGMTTWSQFCCKSIFQYLRKTHIQPLLTKVCVYCITQNT